MLKNTQLNTVIDYDQNLKKLLGRRSSELEVLERSSGLIKSKLMIKRAKDRRQELVASFRLAARDIEMRKLAEEGLVDYSKQLARFD